MSRCFTWFPIGVLGEPEIYQNLGCFTMCGDFTWRVVNLDFIIEEIEGVGFRKGVPPYVILTVIFTGLVLFF